MWIVDPKNPSVMTNTEGKTIAVASSPRHAHLVASAPEMLEVLKTLIATVTDEDTNPCVIADTLQEAERIVDRATYTLAEGTPPLKLADVPVDDSPRCGNCRVSTPAGPCVSCKDQSHWHPA